MIRSPYILALLLLATGAVWLGPGQAGHRDQPAAAPAATASNATAVARIQGFSLADQYERMHHLTFPGPKPTLLTVADRKGSAQVSAWVQPVREWFGDRVSFVGLADVSKVPGVLRGRVRKSFREQLSHPVMLDWQGIHCRALACERDRVNVLLLSTRGEVLLRLSGPANPSDLGRVRQAIETALGLNNGEEPSERPDRPSGGEHQGNQEDPPLDRTPTKPS